MDAYRIESASADLQGALAATYQTGYRLAMIWAGAGAFALAAFFQSTPSGIYDQTGWTWAYLIMAASISVGLATTLLSPAPNASDEESKLRQLEEMRHHVHAFILRHPSLPRPIAKVVGWFGFVCVQPIADFFYRYRWHALAILLLIATYRISDVVMGVMSNPFYRDMGFTKEEVAAVSKIFGVVMTLVGTFIGGIVVLRIGILKTLFVGALLSAGTNLLFSALAGTPQSAFPSIYCQRRQPFGRPCKRCLYCLPVGTHERTILCDTVCGFLLHHADPAEISCGLLRSTGRECRVLKLFYPDRRTRHPGSRFNPDHRLSFAATGFG